MKPSPLLIQKLDTFIRKYYRNQLIRGVLLAGGLLIGAFLVALILEYLGHFGTTGRTVLFWILLLGSGVVVTGWVIRPVLQWARIAGGLSHEQASSLVGEHFPEISDRLLNTLQLQRQLDGDSHQQISDYSLLEASIQTRTEALRPVVFHQAIPLRDTLPYLWYAVPPFLIAVAVLWWKPEVVQEPAGRILAHRQTFIPPPPFAFEVLNTSLEVPASTSFDLAIRVVGSALPDVVFLETNQNRFRLEREGSGRFRYRFPIVRTNTDFRLTAAGVVSDAYTLVALPVPKVISLFIEAQTPQHTRLGQTKLVDVGDLRVPEGTRIVWQITTEDTDRLRMRVGEDYLEVQNPSPGLFQAQWTAQSTVPYWIVPLNNSIGKLDSMRYALRVIPDLPPVIQVTEAIDSLALKQRFFSGIVADDYGFSRLQFAHRWLELAPRNEELLASIESVQPVIGEVVLTTLPVPNGRDDRFFYTWDMGAVGVRQGDVVEYWLELWDNDGVNGPKVTRSTPRTFSPPEDEEIREVRQEASTDIKSQISKAREEAALLREEVESLSRQLREDRELDWKDQRAMESLLERQEELKKQLESIKQANEQKDQRSNEFSEAEERLLEKQEQLQELMDNVMSDELRELYEEMQRLMDEMNPDALEDIQEQVESMAVDQEALEKELDRALEQFKQLEWEVNMDEVLEELRELAEKQEALSEKTEKSETPNDSLQAEQDSLNAEFEDLQERLDELDEANDALENPNPVMDREEERESIEQKMSDSSEQLEQNKNKKAAKNQSDAAEEMQKMAEQMTAMMEQSEEEALEEDLDALRALLENIISLSFDEEGVMAELRKTKPDDPRYIDHGQTQRRLKDDAKMVEDSLFELSKRITQLAPAVNREIGLINHHMEKALLGFGDRMTPEITSNQQYVMTSFNNLALMLDDALQQMQQSMAESQPGSGNCEKPGGNGSSKPSPSAGDMKRMQKALGEKLEKMKESMGQNANKGKSGQGQRPLSKELAKMAAQQAALRKMAERKAQELNEDGSGGGTQMGDIAREMEALERDLVHRDVTLETLERQQNLMVRLLEAENAERMRGEDNKRKSRTGDQNLKEPPSQMTDYLRLKDNEVELLRTVPLELDPYYRERVNDYFNNLDLILPVNSPSLKPQEL